MNRIVFGLLPLFFFAVWWLWGMASAAQLRATEIRRGMPEESRGGVSIFPAIPLFPFFFWGVAGLIDDWFRPWGTVLVGGLHLIFAVFLFISWRKDFKFCQAHDSSD